MNARIYIEGGGDSKELHARCREGFRKLLEKCGFKGRMPRLIACGSRNSTFDDFSTAHANARTGDYVAMLVDSEDPVEDIEQPWSHLKQREGWNSPANAVDDQALLMITCMETWIVSDRRALRKHFGPDLQESSLPNIDNMESRDRGAVQNALIQATRSCRHKYSKGKRSFELVAELDPAELRKHLPGFARCEQVLKDKLR